ncbi:MAG TPA: MFS transporter [Bacillota bacterium]|nr:MFS transporter [Bacillota bacterium]
MTQQLEQEQNERSRLYIAILIIGIIFVSFNLRPGITSVGPLMGMIRDDFGLVNWSVAFLTSLPLLAFAAMSPIVPSLGNRYSNERIMLFGLLLLIAGIGIRSISVVSLLFIGTACIGLGIAICNVLLPGVIKEHFPAKVTLMTSIYSTTMGVFAAIASGLSIPIATKIGWGWPFALLIWTIPAMLAVIIWMYLSKVTNANRDTGLQYVTKSDRRIWRSPLAWQVALYMGLQSSLFYVTITWLPEMLFDFGVERSTAGWLLSYTQIIGMPASLTVPIIAGKLKSQAPLVIMLSTSVIIGYTGLLIGNSLPILVISTTLIGITLGGSFALALTFLAIRARNAKHAAYLSGMAQSIGYLIAACGPIFIGFLYDVTHAWTFPLITLIGIAVLVLIFGLKAGQDRFVLE